jgi:hypothetical protein
MVNITYTILELGSAAVYSVRPSSLRVIYVADKYLNFIDYSAVWFEVQPLTCSFGTFPHLTLDIPKKP